MKPVEQLNILLVDDDIFSSALYGKHLTSLGYDQVTILHDGVSCVNWLSNEPHVIFLDHEMAPWNGLEVLKKIKRHSPDVMVVLLSGQETIGVAVDALKYGAFDYVIKGEGDLDRISLVLDRIQELMKALETDRRSLRGRIARRVAGRKTFS